MAEKWQRSLARPAMSPDCRTELQAADGVAPFMELLPTRTVGLDRLARFLPNAGLHYAEHRNHDDGPPATGAGRGNVSELSPWLRAGLIGADEVLNAVLARHSPQQSEKFIAETFWRIYFKGYLEHRPGIWIDYCVRRDAALAELEHNDDQQTAYAMASQGRTGIAAFDVWAQELTKTGYLHNHARMWFASIWIFTLKLDWQLGADFFLRHLADADAASNTLSWRWVAGLHTKNKHYLARAANIARYTAGRPEGPLSAEGLAEDASPLGEEDEHPFCPPDLPRPLSVQALSEPFALILHDEAAHHVPIGLATSPAAVIGAARPQARSLGEVSTIARSFATGAVAHGCAEAAAAFGCPSFEWQPEQQLDELLARAGINRVVVPYLPTGWTRDALWPDLSRLAEEGRIIFSLPRLERATWPLARAGFFRVAKAIPTLLRDCEIDGLGKARR